MVAAAPVPQDPRFALLRAPAPEDDFAHDVRVGLTAARKWLPPRWFYDQLGSSLFDTICFLPEYYVMRAEAQVLTTHHAEIAAALGTSPLRLVELGSGAARKTRILLDALTHRRTELEYVPVDVDESMLERTGRDLLREYDDLRVVAVRSDFRRPSVPLALLPRTRSRTVVLFLGSTIGNLSPQESTVMLRDLRSALAPGDALFLGADLRKDRTILEPAYDDALGVTAAFNLNLLGRINRELGGAFDLSAFRHLAFYDEEHGRMEMHLVSRRVQRVRIDALDLEIAFDEDERIHTESSYKHDMSTLRALAESSQFTIANTWTDSRRWFADVLLLAT
ncbi:MAG TPA: L-histidine N(alpha)-methyltransferase [Thermoanaerobaculia bacterium]|nr:L-histidine N(alpha)-methyltransferase [Thermoanaerobaculia bacterium]